MRKVLIALLVLVLVAVASFAAIIVVRPTFAQPLLTLIGASDAGSAPASQSASEDEPFAALGDTAPNDAEVAAAEREWLERHRTPRVAQVSKVDLHSPIQPADLTGVLFHQASNTYALVLSTKLPEADYEKTEATRSIRVNRDQEEGDWLDADALHLWRTEDTTAMDTSIDVGAKAGTTARSPVTGTVVLLRDYMLYEEIPDIEIHIQPEGRPDLDCVLIHTTDPLVKAGDKVEAGITELCHVRDIEKDLTDVQLSFFTPEGVGGNHIHVQVNDTTTEGYRKNRLPGAVKVKD